MLLTAARRRKRNRTRYALGLCAAMALAPALYLLASGGGSRGHELTAGAPQTTVVRAPTWRAPDRIVEEPPPTTSVPTTTTTEAPVPDVEVATTAPPTTLAAAVATVPTTEAPESTAPITEVPESTVPTTTPTTEPPETTTTTTTTTTTAPAAAPAAASLTPTAAPAHTERGQATWFNAPDNSCAHRTAPIGTIITVTRVDTNASTTCYVDQWGPEAAYRVIDLSMDTFEKLAPAWVGVIEVVIEW